MSKLTTIKQDIRDDVSAAEGKDFNGPNVAKMYGELSAVVYALACILEEFVSDGSFTVGSGS